MPQFQNQHHGPSTRSKLTVTRFVGIGLSLLVLLGQPALPVRAAAATPAQAALAPERRQKLDAYFDLLDKYHKLMGSVSIAQQGKVIYQRQLGYADQAAGLKTGPETRFRIGSISKVFTSVLIFQLIEAGQLSLDTLLSAFYPDIPNAGKITISMLLNHRSGIENFTASEDYAKYMTQPQSRAAMLERIRKGKSVFAPDSKAEYSNSNYLLLTLILEKLTGKSYAQVLDQKIVQPLGLKHTRFGGPIVSKTNEAHSYAFDGKNWIPTPETDVSIPLGAGAVVSTPEDLNLFMRALFQGKLVSKASLASITDLREGYGRGMFGVPFKDMKGFGHNGAIDGFQSATAYFPAEDLNLSLTANGVHMEFNEMLIGLMSLFKGQAYAIPDFSLQPIQLAPAALPPYTGLYASKEIPLKIELKIIDGSLHLQATGQAAIPLVPYPKHEFRQEQIDLRIVFDPPVAGKFSTFLIEQSGQILRFTREKWAEHSRAAGACPCKMGQCQMKRSPKCTRFTASKTARR